MSLDLQRLNQPHLVGLLPPRGEREVTSLCLIWEKARQLLSSPTKPKVRLDQTRSVCEQLTCSTSRGSSQIPLLFFTFCFALFQGINSKFVTMREGNFNSIILKITKARTICVYFLCVSCFMKYLVPCRKNADTWNQIHKEPIAMSGIIPGNYYPYHFPFSPQWLREGLRIWENRRVVLSVLCLCIERLILRIWKSMFT